MAVADSPSVARLKLLHPKMAVIIACVLSTGHFLSPQPLNLERYVLGVAGVLIAVFGVYRINEVIDFRRRGNISRREHVATASVLIFIGIVTGVYLSLKYALWILVLLVVGVFGVLGYNLTRSRIIHNRAFYGFVWGALPCYCSYALQSLNPVPTPSVWLLSAFWGVVAVQSLWLWGTRGCRLQAHCTRVSGRPSKRVCHSPTIRCIDRYKMPREIRHHTRIMINIQVVAVVLLTVAVGVWRLG